MLNCNPTCAVEITLNEVLKITHPPHGWLQQPRHPLQCKALEQIIDRTNCTLIYSTYGNTATGALYFFTSTSTLSQVENTSVVSKVLLLLVHLLKLCILTSCLYQHLWALDMHLSTSEVLSFHHNGPSPNPNPDPQQLEYVFSPLY